MTGHDFDIADGWCHTHRAHCSMSADKPTEATERAE